MTDRELIEMLIVRLETLEKEVSHLRTENSKNSWNSSIPSSKDENRPKRNQSLRKATGKKPGGQPGRKGNTLKMTADPDHTVELRPDYCRSCGSSLTGIPSIFDGSRQIVDTPPIKAVWTEYRAYARQCGCGCRTIADFPEGVGSPIGYGSNIEGLIGYFHSRQYLPFKRMQEMMNDVFNIDISEGGIHYLLGRFAHRSTPVYDMIRQRVERSRVVGTDETGIKVDRDKHWFWTWQTPDLTYIALPCHQGKGRDRRPFPKRVP